MEKSGLKILVDIKVLLMTRIGKTLRSWTNDPLTQQVYLPIA